MAFESLGAYLAALERRGELKRIAHPVSLDREITEIHRRVLARGGPALMFENAVHPDGRPAGMPVCANLFGTKARIAFALDRRPEELRELGELLAFLRQPAPPRSLREAVDLVPVARQAMAMRAKTVRRAPCQEIVLEGAAVDLGRLPIQICWPDEPAPLITWGVVVTRGPDPAADREDDFNLGIYRMQVLGPDRTAMRWLKHRGGARHHARWAQERREPLPAAVVIGADPATLLAAVTPVPDTLSEYAFAGLLRREPVRLVPCRTVPLKVPAEAEIVLEGHVSLDELVDEGPYGDHTGYYNAVEKFPVFRISAITMRRDPVYLTTYTGRPPDEPSILGEALNEVFIPLIRQQFPEIVDFWLPPEGCSYRIAVVSIRKRYQGHAKRIMMGVWSYLRQFLYTKIVIVVDDDIDARDWKDVMWAISTRADPVRDTLLIPDAPIDYLDFASPKEGLGGKMGIDATNKWPGETDREWGRLLEMDAATIARVDEIWDALGLG